VKQKINLQDFKASFFEEAFFNLNQTYIHPTAIIGDNVILEDNVKIGPYCVVVGNVIIKSGTRLHAHVVIGFPAQNIGTQYSLGALEIGKNCEIREFATIHASKYPHGKTIIGDNCYIMSYAHVSHDCVLENNVTLINSVNLGGHTHIEKNVIIMANSATHQFCRIGQFTALAPFSGIRQDLPPFCIFNGQPAGFAGLNLIGLKRAGLSQENINGLKHVTKLLYQDKLLLSVIEAQAACESWGQDTYVQYFIAFVKNSSRGVSRKTIADNAIVTDSPESSEPK